MRGICIKHKKCIAYELEILTAKRVKIEGGKSYRYRPVEGYIHRLTPSRCFHLTYLKWESIKDRGIS